MLGCPECRSLGECEPGCTWKARHPIRGGKWQCEACNEFTWHDESNACEVCGTVTVFTERHKEADQLSEE
jgi:hypothetical protein